MVQRHLIGKLVWEIKIRSSRDAHLMQQKVSDLVWKDLSPELNRMFDRLVGPDQLLRLDRVELDLGHIDIQASSPTGLTEQIVRSMEDWCFRTKMFPSNIESKDSDLRQSPEIPLARHYFENWLNWLKTGVFPPYTLVPESDWIEKVLETLVLEHQAVDRLKEVLMGDPWSLRRLVLQHSERELRSLVELYTGHPQTCLLEASKEIGRLLKAKPGLVSGMSNREVEVEIWISVLSKVILEKRRLASEEIIKDLVRGPLPWQLVLAMEKLEGEEAKKFPLLKDAIRKTGRSLLIKTQDEKIIGRPISAKDKALDDSPASMEVQEILTPQFFTNAGMVLLHPFLRHLFQRLQLLKGSDFRNEQCRSKAILLLQYLGTGDDKVADHQLLLPKFLCGMAANWPMDHTMTLTKKAKQYADELLGAAIDHWGALWNTSIDGLREGFLTREGKLEQEESGWRLYVEHKAIDVLLDRLPWNLSLIKLPWMKELLHVEWR